MTSPASSYPDSGAAPGAILAVCGAQGRLMAALCRDGLVAGSFEADAPSRTQQILGPMVRALLESASLAPGDLAGVACVRGPGSFTGLRMSLAFCLGLARAAGLPMAGLEHLPLVAFGAAPALTGTLAVLTRSRTRQVYAQLFTAPTGTPMGDVAVVNLDGLPALAREVPGQLWLAGGGVRDNAAALKDLLPQALVLPPHFDHPRPEALAAAAARAKFSLDPVAPMYLRASDAEDNLADIARARGMDPDEAARRLDRATTGIDPGPGE